MLPLAWAALITDEVCTIQYKGRADIRVADGISVKPGGEDEFVSYEPSVHGEAMALSVHSGTFCPTLPRST